MDKRDDTPAVELVREILDGVSQHVRLFWVYSRGRDQLVLQAGSEADPERLQLREFGHVATIRGGSLALVGDGPRRRERQIHQRRIAQRTGPPAIVGRHVPLSGPP